jgi:hypothetical protein
MATIVYCPVVIYEAPCLNDPRAGSILVVIGTETPETKQSFCLSTANLPPYLMHLLHHNAGYHEVGFFGRIYLNEFSCSIV